MFKYVVFACGLAFTAAVSPGPLLAFLMASVLRKGWKKTLPACFAPLISDIPAAVLAIFFLSNLTGLMSRVLRGAGGVFLIYLAVITFVKSRKKSEENEGAKKPEPKTIIQAVMVNILNPNPYMGWSLVLGPALLEAWHQDPLYGAALLAAFYGTMVITLALTIILLGTTDFLGAKARLALVYVSGALLSLLGIYQLALCVIK